MLIYLNSNTPIYIYIYIYLHLIYLYSFSSGNDVSNIFQFQDEGHNNITGSEFSVADSVNYSSHIPIR